MIKEFEGKSEKEAIDNAVLDLNLDREDFDVEIIESSRRGLFRKGNVRIRVHIDDDDMPLENENNTIENSRLEEKIQTFVENVIEKMGYPGKVDAKTHDNRKVVVKIDSEFSGILIGKKGKNLDALQTLVNVYASKNNSQMRIVIDTENYRRRHEENIKRVAAKTADQVRKSKRSKLLEPMNPFERRLVHTTLNTMDDIDTKSEGDGMYKQVRILYREIPDN